MLDADLDEEVWAEATTTAVSIQKRTLASALNGKIPFELWTYEKPDISHSKVFASTVMIHIPKEKRLKCDKKAERGILVGYPDDVKGYRVYNPKTKAITTSQDVITIQMPLAADQTTGTDPGNTIRFHRDA